MKIAFSDYDGTLMRSAAFDDTRGVTESDLAAIRAWQAAGNKFCIATGRNYGLLKIDLDKYQIPIDYMVGTNGAALFTGAGEVIAQHTLDRETMRQLFATEAMHRYRNGMLIITPLDNYGYRPRTDVPSRFLHPLASLDEAQEVPGVVQISTEYADAAETAAAFAEIDQALPGKFAGNMNRSFLDLNVAGCSKADGIAELISQIDGKVDEVLTIGDDRNDLPMIERYHGFTVNTSKDFVQAAAAKVYDSVGDMLRDHM